VKLAISAGLVTFALIGNKTTSHYVVVGKPIWDVKAAESISSAGDIVVAPAAWHYVNTNDYLFKEMPDNIHIKLLGVGPNWRSVQKNVRQQKPQILLDDGSIYDESSESDPGSDMTTQDGGFDEFSCESDVQIATNSSADVCSETSSESGCQTQDQGTSEEIHHHSCDEEHRYGRTV
jgi:adenylate cyclase 10